MYIYTNAVYLVLLSRQLLRRGVGTNDVKVVVNDQPSSSVPHGRESGTSESLHVEGKADQ